MDTADHAQQRASRRPNAQEAGVPHFIGPELARRSENASTGETKGEPSGSQSGVTTPSTTVTKSSGKLPPMMQPPTSDPTQQQQVPPSVAEHALGNREDLVAFLKEQCKQEEMKTWKKIDDTKKRTGEILTLKKRNEDRIQKKIYDY